MMNHINSYKRKALFGKSAYDFSKGSLPEDFFILLGLEPVEPGFLFFLFVMIECVKIF